MSDDATGSLFAEWRNGEDPSEQAFAAFCAAHPQHAEPLRAMYVDHARMERALADVTRTTGGGADSDSWKEYLLRVGKLGPPPERYVRGAVLGSGGMGAIHHVADALLDRGLVVKQMLDEAGDAPGTAKKPDDRSLGRFLDEAKVTARLDHPYIVPVHDIGLDATGRVYFAMKRVRGEDLRGIYEKIQSGVEGWTTTKGIQVLLKVCEGMAYAHSKRVIHRDLKPGNVMVGKFGEVYVMDWGLARIQDAKDTKDIRVRDSVTVSVLRSERREKQSARGETPETPLVTMDGDVVGTPAYMPLEQAEGNLEAIGERSDIYAVGAMLYHLLAGTPPYVAAGELVSGRVIWQRVKTRPPSPLHELAPNAPAELVAIVDKAMARESDHRYAGMKALASDLQAYLDKKVVSAYATGALAELKKWVQRNPALSAAAALLIVVLAGATAIVLKKNAEVEARNADLSSANSEIRNQKATVEAKNKEVESKNVEITAQKAEVESMNVEITAQKAAVETKRIEAESRKAEFDQLSGVVLLADATRKEVELYPPWPSKIGAMEDWLAHDAARVVELKPMLAATLLEIEKRATASRAGDPAPLASRQFASDADRFLHETLSKLATDIAAFESGTTAGVAQRLDWARTIHDLTLHHPNARVTWDEARAAMGKADDVMASKLYAGANIELNPESPATNLIGLVPIGMNPVTKLWEFYDLRSACDVAAAEDPSALEIPRFREDGSGNLETNGDTGLVFVLLPGGTFLEGAQKQDEDGANYDPRALGSEFVDGKPVSVTLRPFLISKYEMTQGQWSRLTGSNPSYFKSQDPKRTGLDRPIENVSWDDCTALFSRFGLHLPTEARWELACRAGTSTVFSFGSEDAVMATHGNVRDRSLASLNSNTDPGSVDPFDDGMGTPCEVGHYASNAFGLFDLHGNVWEWCQDAFGDYRSVARPGDGLREPADTSTRITRGGSYYDRSVAARSSLRNRNTPDYRSNILGARPTRDCD